ncbi:hypothetical protein [Acetobacterium bakii]|uniref:Uncharacterized protein n=1 Tax=Acetobacterium bakii TaxID=52689 RepID=A0A0L6TV80_9FIRM|nr:hypothetical protein [Acetobacterium bakii]KNZ40184.1 hypothetical protein AKG39_19075 [Acetobacterium bakii]
MAVYIQEHRIINTPKSICEERLITIAIKGYALRNNRVIDKETVITLETKNAFSSNGQRITIALKEEDEQTTGVTIRSELTSNIQLKDRGINQKNIDIFYKYLEIPKQAEDGSATDREPKIAHKDKKRSKKKFNWFNNTRTCQMRIMATYLGGHNDLKKSLKGSLEIHTHGFEFCVLGPKINIPASFIHDVKVCGNAEIRANPEWLAACLKNTLTKSDSKNPTGKEKKTKIVVSYLNEGASDYCIFNADSQLSGEADAAKAEVLIRKLMII